MILRPQSIGPRRGGQSTIIGTRMSRSRLATRGDTEVNSGFDASNSSLTVSRNVLEGRYNAGIIASADSFLLRYTLTGAGMGFGISGACIAVRNTDP